MTNLLIFIACFGLAFLATFVVLGRHFGLLTRPRWLK